VGRTDAPVLIDQEGGRVQRLGPPHWKKYPPGKSYGALYAANALAGRELTRLGARLIAHDLRALGITCDCVPVLDVPVPGAHDIIGDRAYGLDPATVAILGRAAAEGLLAGGVLPVIKHIPGHGRAGADSHEHLPVVQTERSLLEAQDFVPFRHLADMPLAMTAHVVYAAIDANAPATTSKRMIRDVIRSHIGFGGLLMSDDLSMKALSGTFGQRTKASLKAGCDIVLHCNGDMVEMKAIAKETPKLSGKAARRAEAALARFSHRPEPLDAAEARAKLDAALAALL
ncbi:MAG: glycoside hydrolase family 3 N-terminal domain-containing protein, partial [Beijerinckiaceae bacterium]